jgi:tetratricopeptide (TPR) repeat protein
VAAFLDAHEIKGEPMTLLSIRYEVLTFALLAGAALAFAPASVAQYGGNNPPPSLQQPAQKPAQAQPGQQQQQPEQPKVDPEEEKAFQAFYNIDPTQPDKVIQSGEQFLQKYPQSKYAGQVYSRLTQAYYNKQDVDKMLVAGDKALAANPDDVTVLVLVGWVIPHKYDPNDPEMDRRLAKAEGYDKHALQVLSTMPKPATLSDDQFTKVKADAVSRAHAGLGLVYFWRQNYNESASEMSEAIKASPEPDSTDLYVIGKDYENLKKFSDAADAFQKCAQVPGQLQARCKQYADDAKKQAASQPPAK